MLFRLQADVFSERVWAVDDTEAQDLALSQPTDYHRARTLHNAAYVKVKAFACVLASALANSSISFTSRSVLT